MNINQLKYFVAVAEYQSFTQAAERYFLSQTAITLQIRTLEETLGTQLIDRQKRPIELTAAGKVFLREAKAIISRMEEAVEKTVEASKGLVGTIRVGYEKGYERSNLSDTLRGFHRLYPNVLLTCYREDTDTLAAKLLADDLDIIFGWDSTNITQRDDIESRLLMKSPFVVALYSGHSLASHTSLTREDLNHETLLYATASENGSSLGDAHYLELYEKAGYHPNILLKSNDVESILLMVSAEEGIAILPLHIVAKLTNAEHLVFVPLEGEEEYEDIYVLWKKSNNNEALKLLIDYAD